MRRLLFLLALAACAAPAAAADKDAEALADRIDHYLATAWHAGKVQPAPAADDAEFFRRSSLDLTGRVASVADARRFLKDTTPDKRRRVIEDLLESPGHITHQTNVWRALLVPEVDANFELRYMQQPFEAWVRKQFENNVPYDQMVRSLLTQPFGRRPNEMVYGSQQQGNASPALFYTAKEGKPENLAASTARLFLGVRIECAQCHDHPFARWKREQFWGMAAFFAGLDRRGDGFYAPIQERIDRRELAITGTERVVQATFLDGAEPLWKFKEGPRVTLADWLTAADNPWFARAAANRVWAQLFGIGLIEPVDDLNDENRPSHPELLDELARQFAAHKFDLKYLIKAIAFSKAYQLSSVATHPSQDDPRQFARMAVKGLTPEQLFDSLTTATGFRDQTPMQQRIYDFNSKRAQFVARFAAQEKRTEHQTSIPQALALMNSSLVADVTSLERSETLAAVADAPFLDASGKVETVYLAALGRKPRADEMAKMSAYVQSGGAAKDPRKALSDVFWALLNSPEFILNH